MLDFCKANKDDEWCPSQPTASRWLKIQQALRDNRLRPPKKPGRKPKDVNDVVEIMASRRDELLKEDYERYVDMADCSKKTLKRRMKEMDIVRPRMCKMEGLTGVEKERRKEYERRHKDQQVDLLWQWVHWTGEACVEFAGAVEQYNTRTGSSSEGLLMEIDACERLVLWMAASVSWFHKSGLVCWNDVKEEDLVGMWKASRPRRGLRNLSEERYQAQMKEWRSKRPTSADASGSLMKQHVYSREMLPQHIRHLQAQKADGSPAYLMYTDIEDGAPAPVSDVPPANGAREKARIQLHILPLQSPDLNPTNACFILLNEKLKQRHGDQSQSMDYWQLRQAIETVWHEISLDEIRGFIKDLPRRRERLSEGHEGRIRGSSW